MGNNIGVDPSEIYECIAPVGGHFGWLNPLTKVFYYIGVNCYIIAKICANFVDASGRHFILFGRTVKIGAHRIESQPPTPLIILTQ